MRHLRQGYNHSSGKEGGLPILNAYLQQVGTQDTGELLDTQEDPSAMTPL